MVLVVRICVSGTNLGPINLEENVGIEIERVDIGLVNLIMFMTKK